MEASPPIFEIKIAVIGDTDKTFVWNSLLGDDNKCCEISTTSVHEFAISTAQWELVVEHDDEKPSEESSNQKEIQDELCGSDKVTTRRSEVELEEPLFEMRKDTQLVLVDIPGFDNTDEETNYKDYIENKWNTFDCVVIVIDWSQSIEDQASLLQLVKDNAVWQHDIPVVVLLSKLEDGKNKEQVKLLSQALQQVKKIFGVSDLR